VRGRYEAELKRLGLLTYDGMLSRLADELRKQGRDGTLARAIRDRYDAAIVDEFQDTDAAQWGILRTAFVEAQIDGPADCDGRRFFAVGDPKQSIYSFRNADIDVYLAAKARCAVQPMTRNYRSDGPLVTALNYVWKGSRPDRNVFAVENIEYDEVDAENPGRVTGLPRVGARERRPLEIRWFDGKAFAKAATKLPRKADAERLVGRACALEARELLSAGKLRIGGDEGPAGRALRPGDLAVLTRTNDQAVLIRDELTSLGIPAVAASRAKVFNSEPATWLLTWLDALAQPASESPARRLAVTPLVGWTTARLANELLGKPTEGEKQDDWDTFRRSLAAAAQVWPTQGFFRVFDAATRRWGVWARLLGSQAGERAATDLRHLCELLHAEERRTRCGPQALAEWLRRRISEADEEDEEQTQRLESDASAVQIVTVHSSKGLQYPIVMLPFGWTTWKAKNDVGPKCWSPPKGCGRVVDLNNPETRHRHKEVIPAIQARSDQEDTRLLYVAMTRALHHVVLWTGAYPGSEASATGRLLFPPATAIKGPNKQWSEDKAAAALTAVKQALDALCADPDKGVGWSQASPPGQDLTSWVPRDEQGAVSVDLPAAPRIWSADHVLGGGWMVASYSSMAGGKGVDLDEPVWRVEPEEEAGEQDAEGLVGLDPGVHGWEALAADPDLHTAAAGHDLPGGTKCGNWLHSVFEHLAFQGPNGGQARDGRPLDELVRDEGHRLGVPQEEAHARAVELVPDWLDTPLHGGGRLPDGFSLRHIADADRLDELGFDLRLGVGTGRRATGRDGRLDGAAARRALAAAMDAPGFGGREWLAAVLERRDDQGRPRSPLPAIAGVLTGFVDLTFRTGGRGADGVYWIADYKTNQVTGPNAVAEWHARLGETEEQPPRLRGLHYSRPLLSWAMAHSAYHLQALLYTVALHRLLRSRLGEATYDYDRHVGGHLYLFLRGMAGPDTPRPGGGSALGVWTDRWPRRTVEALDCALSGGTDDAVKAVLAKFGGDE